MVPVSPIFDGHHITLLYIWNTIREEITHQSLFQSFIISCRLKGIITSLLSLNATTVYILIRSVYCHGHAKSTTKVSSNLDYQLHHLTKTLCNILSNACTFWDLPNPLTTCWVLLLPLHTSTLLVMIKCFTVFRLSKRF